MSSAAWFAAGLLVAPFVWFGVMFLWALLMALRGL